MLPLLLPFILSGRSQVVKPFTTLLHMKLQVKEIPLLARYLLDVNFLPTYSYWRDFHPSRTLYRVRDVAALLIDDTAKQDLARLDQFSRLDQDGQRKLVEEIIEWSRQNADMTREQLLLATIESATRCEKFARAAEELADDGNRQLLPVLLRRQEEFADRAAVIAEFAHRLDDPAAATPAREWAKDSEPRVRLWGGLILLKHGEQGEGLATLKSLLHPAPDLDLLFLAADDLLAHGGEAGAALVAHALEHPGFAHDWNRSAILHRLMLAGRPEARDYLLRGLNDTAPVGTTSILREGQRVEVELVAGGVLAMEIAEWRTDGWAFELEADAEQRAVQRGELRAWVDEQFERIRAGRPHAVGEAPEQAWGREWQLDAP